MSKSIVVSVVCTTYNQEAFIGQAVDSFLAQRLSVPYEIIIHDDASTDSTPEILKGYAERYPDVIKVIQQQSNKYSTGQRVFDLAVCHARGEYIAPCEGDDFWCEPLKLEKQLAFLKEHADYGAVFTDTNVLDQSTQSTALNHDASRGFQPPAGDVKADLVRGNPYKSCSVLLKADALKGYHQHADFLKVKMLDYILWLHVASNYKIGYLNESMATYRVLLQSASHFSSHTGKIRFEKNAYKVAVYFNKYFGSIVKKNELKSAYAHNLFIYFLKKRQFKAAAQHVRCDRYFAAQALAVVKRQMQALVHRW
ncbi:glycosyltransferase [Pseudomonas fragi]|uniref:glycosyltransferase n=1 Tax=Pseudomonas fragi TaxID=296 RepID=UPI00193C0517|nr:glycosyltransferase [Pseudomonas fragi]MBM1203136.1 glycosyltransferase [Pseudomonas fragi]WRT59429.1 glycosyltransferase [Pseudomonas fragi]